ncbi:MAG TPA: glycosyltransferase family 39 protein [Vicinamibacterales bacterium]|nr:glycosyltransferase family 39 protein [Vicinamibacterales bacterium]
MRQRSWSAAAALLAAATLYTGVHWGSTVGGGADSYGYVSQAGLWLRGTLRIRQDIVRASPWPLAAETWAPLGYRPAPGDRDFIVPLYPPGLPLLMALVQAVGGFCAAFLVVPVCGAATIWLTYRLAQGFFGIPAVSVASAALVAASPIFLYQLMNPMSDVPVTAAWALAVLLVVDGWTLAAGFAAGAAVLIRPNLAPIAIAPLVWLVMTRGRALRFLAGLALAATAVAAINAALYGSPWVSGYGTAGDLYALRYLATNLRQFSAWTVETSTPVVALAAVFFVAPGLVAPACTPRLRLLAGGWMAAIIVSYLFYLPFDAWWYLRFLLPMWPVLSVMLAVALHAIIVRLRAPQAVFALCILALAANGVRIAAQRYAFDIGRAEGRYVDVARFVAGHSDQRAVMIAVQHTGTLRLYGGRLTLRFDQLDPLWLDRVVTFLRDSGRHPYVVLDDAEVERFRARFGRANAVGRLDWPPMATLATTAALAALASPAVVIYDAVDRAATTEPLAIGSSRRTGWRCNVPYLWPPRLRME